MSNVATREDEARAAILRRVEVSQDGCWNWTGALSRGYGQLTFKGKHSTAHRFAYAELVAPISEGLWVLHHCDNRRCVNPEHLYQGTPIDNRADMLDRGRWKHPLGQRTACSKGHEYADHGYSINKSDGSRVCKTCQRDHKRAQRAKAKGAAA